MTSFEGTNFVCNTTDEKNSSSISIPGHWRSFNYLEDGIFDELKRLIKLRTQNYIEVQVEEVKKRGIK